MQIVMSFQRLKVNVGIKVIADLVDGECIFSAALMDADGFTIERTSSQFKPTAMNEILDLNPDSELITVVGEESTIIISKLETGHSIVIQCPNDGNLGKARLKLSKAKIAILPFL
jgi:predicted regulator of Ras-like GTPase activity (Roadblock/LC7/MglB family)|tara:strand:- start:84 stop:428 length:345 start_codon:yes stop_codon:yes gene_type:complete